MVRHTGTRHWPIIAHYPKYRIEGTAPHNTDRGSQEWWKCNTWTVNKPLIDSSPQNLLSDALDIVPLHSPRLPPPYGHLPTHFGTVGGVNWRFFGIERCSSVRGVWFPRREEFCIMRPAISAPWLLVNKFTVLTIEDPNTIDSELVDALPLNLLVATPLHRPKWEKSVRGYPREQPRSWVRLLPKGLF